MAATRNKPPIDLIDRVGDFVAARLSAHEPLCIGLSGGCDSVVLLHLLSRLGLGQRLFALHVHHGLSPNADAWAEFCGAYCESLDVRWAVRRVTVDRASGLGLEAAARAARYSAFAQWGIRAVFLGHHAGDQAETLLFNLLRGTGVTGMAAMQPERRWGEISVLRPMLTTTRREIEAYARQENLAWINDESNADTRFSRNFIRHDVLTVIDQRFPAAERALAQAAANCAEADALLDELAQDDWKKVAESDAANLRRLQALSPIRLKNLLRYRLRHLAWRAPVASRLEEFARQLLAAAPDRHPQLDLPDGCMRVERGGLHWLPRK